MNGLLRVVAPHFIAGAVINAGRATRCAPIIRWMMGMDIDTIKRRHKKGWRLEFYPD